MFYLGELGDKIEIEIVFKVDYVKGVFVLFLIYLGGGICVFIVKVVFGYGL